MTTLHFEERLSSDYAHTALRRDAREGLTARPKFLRPVWFYDARGSALFEEITRLPEYYPFDAEREILRAHADDIARVTRAQTLLELGSGSSEKTRPLLTALRDTVGLPLYVPVDVSESALFGATHALRDETPELAVHAVIADFSEGLGHLPGHGRRLVAFLGGTVGNLTPDERSRFLADVRAALGPDDALLLGTDLVKDPATLVAAYDDAAGVTAEFNRNVLRVLNRELGSAFDLASFHHVARWDDGNEWIEMLLRSTRAQTVPVPELGLEVTFEAGEDLRTEISAKFRPDGVVAELHAAGLAMTHWWTDPAERFAVSLSVPA